jgi:hypothetical protein
MPVGLTWPEKNNGNEVVQAWEEKESELLQLQVPHDGDE